MATSVSTKQHQKTTRPPARRGPPFLSLERAMRNPQLLVWGGPGKQVTVIKDLYPKAKHHYLVLPECLIPSLAAVSIENLDILRLMHETALEVAAKHFSGESFRMGYHARPSMRPLHLHVISEDMNGPSMKNKKNWNTFTTDFFVSSESVLEQLQSRGKITLPSDKQCKKLLETPLKCHKCPYLGWNMPDLKRHLTEKH